MKARCLEVFFLFSEHFFDTCFAWCICLLVKVWEVGLGSGVLWQKKDYLHGSDLCGWQLRTFLVDLAKIRVSRLLDLGSIVSSPLGRHYVYSHKAIKKGREPSFRADRRRYLNRLLLSSWLIRQLQHSLQRSSHIVLPAKVEKLLLARTPLIASPWVRGARLSPPVFINSLASFSHASPGFSRYQLFNRVIHSQLWKRPNILSPFIFERSLLQWFTCKQG